jgi:hypothetical protein
MHSRLVVDSSHQLQEFRETGHQPQNPVVRIVAKIISWVFHPLFIPVYIAWFLMSTQPFLFASFTPAKKMITLLQFFIMYSFFPLVTVLLSKALGFLDSIYLKTQRERIIPYIACGIYYFWMCYVLRNQPQYSKEVVQLSMAIFIASSIGLLVNIYMKVSMHAISMGILLAFMLMLSFTQSGNYTIYLSIAFLLAGLVCTARFIVSDHTPPEIYSGLLVGLLSQLIAVWADGILP